MRDVLKDCENGVQLSSGKILEAEKAIGLTKHVINIFADEDVSIEEAYIILEIIKDAIQEFSKVQKITSVL